MGCLFPFIFPAMAFIKQLYSIPGNTQLCGFFNLHRQTCNLINILNALHSQM